MPSRPRLCLPRARHPQHPPRDAPMLTPCLLGAAASCSGTWCQRIALVTGWRPWRNGRRLTRAPHFDLTPRTQTPAGPNSGTEWLSPGFPPSGAARSAGVTVLGAAVTPLSSRRDDAQRRAYGAALGNCRLAHTPRGAGHMCILVSCEAEGGVRHVPRNDARCLVSRGVVRDPAVRGRRYMVRSRNYCAPRRQQVIYCVRCRMGAIGGPEN